jgi:uncharacterized protein (DUF111 family)
MKKNRPGTLITVLTKCDAAEEICQLLMRETGTLGVRYRLQQRFFLTRRQETLSTPWGPVRIKVAQTEAGSFFKKAEFEDCQAIARQNKIPLRDVYAAVQKLISNDIFK